MPLVSDFLQFKKNQVSRKHLDDMSKHLKLFCIFIGNIRINEINPQMISGFIQELGEKKVEHTERKVTPATVNRYLASLKGFFRYCKDFEYLEKNPMRTITAYFPM